MFPRVPLKVGESGVASSSALLTTCHLQRDGLADLLRLVASVEAAVRAGEVDRLRHLILVQGCAPQQEREVAAQLPQWVELFTAPDSLSAPVARNELIGHLLESDAFDAAGFVAFPDDDAWYPPGALACVARHFRNGEDVELLVTHYGPSPSVDSCDRLIRASLQQALSNGACATIFVRGRLLVELQGFHHLLGLGTELRGGEDTEFVHRAFHRSGGKVVVVPGVLVGHATADPVKKAQYFEGALAALMAHADSSKAARLALLRKVAVGLWLVMRRRLSAAQYLDAIRKARDYASVIRAGPKAPIETSQLATD